MRKPDIEGLSVIIGMTMIVAAPALYKFAPGTPSWFLFLIGACGGWLAIFPLASRRTASRTLIAQGHAPADIREKFKINLGFTRF